MIPSTPKRVRILAALVAAFTLLTLAYPVAAAPRGSKATFTVTPLIGAVSPNQLAALDVFIRNDGTGTWTHADFTAVASAGAIASVTVTQGSVLSCGFAAATATCDLDKVDSLEVIRLRIEVTAPANGTVTLDGSLVIAAAGGNQQSASDDTFMDNGVIPVNASGNFFGRWQDAHGNGFTVGTAATGQFATVTVPPINADYPLTIEELNAPIVCNGTPVAGFGNTVELHVANGGTVDPFLTLTLTYDRATAGSKGIGNTGFVHQRDDGTCEFPPRNCDQNPGFCFDVTNSGGGPNKLLIITAQLPTNGRGRGV
jgi:hypothetical protein